MQQSQNTTCRDPLTPKKYCRGLNDEARVWLCKGYKGTMLVVTDASEGTSSFYKPCLQTLNPKP